jgi:P-type Cu+ transporter
MSVTELGITGMSCASCVAHVTQALKDVRGVEDASVNLATERATVRHDGSVVPNALIAAVESAGYEASATIDEDRETLERERSRKRMFTLMLGAIALGIPTMLIAMLTPEFAYKTWVLALLTIPVWGVVGWEFHGKALRALRSGSTTMDTLVSLGSTAALAIGYFETASAIVTLVFIGRYLELAARSRSNRAMRELLGLRPDVAQRRDADGNVHTVPLGLVCVDDVLIVAAGERVPVDGVILEGMSTIDRSLLTGESLPVDVSPGTRVEQGTINGDGTLILRATAVGAGTELARIVELVRRAQGTTPPVQRLADRIAGVFVPVILGIATLTFVGWLVVGHNVAAAIITAVAVLVVACPCALGLATPTAIIAGVGVAARRGVLFKDASALERIGNVNVVAFDKTGTLTDGNVTILERPANDALALAAAIESTSTHPLAMAIVAAAREAGLVVRGATGVTAARGLGIAGTVDGARVVVGNATYLANAGVALADESSSNSLAYIARDGTLVGRMTFGDTLRPGAASAIAALRERGIAAILVSGDAHAPVESVARATGITEWHANALPDAKAEVVAVQQREGRIVAFVGDGINDAPALARADVGFAQGGGSAVALETADAALLSDDPQSVVVAIDIARATLATIRQNLFWAFIYNIVLVPLAVFGVVSPMYAAGAMGLSSLFVVGNSLRLSAYTKIRLAG